MKIAIIGGGAAGFFSAITVKENYPDANVVIFEKSKNLLSKIKISGGGRCNVSNGTTSIKELSKAYPRGEKELRKAFQVFNTKHAWQWFEAKNVPLMVQSDGRVFPKSQNSQTIIDCFLSETQGLGIKIELGKGIKSIKQINNKTIKTIKNCIKNVVKLYNKRNLTIATITGNDKFDPLKQDLQNKYNITHNPTTVDEHVTEMEIMICIVKKCI